jgi:hypothetical protein
MGNKTGDVEREYVQLLWAEETKEPAESVFEMVKVAKGWDFRGSAGRRRWRRCEGCYTVGGLRVNGERRG